MTLSLFQRLNISIHPGTTPLKTRTNGSLSPTEKREDTKKNSPRIKRDESSNTVDVNMPNTSHSQAGLLLLEEQIQFKTAMKFNGATSKLTKSVLSLPADDSRILEKKSPDGQSLPLIEMPYNENPHTNLRHFATNTKIIKRNRANF